jgi:hypothetical protein
MISRAAYAETENAMNFTHHLQAQYRRCGQCWRILMLGATLEEEKKKPGKNSSSSQAHP